MKKIFSIILTMLMLLSAVSVLANAQRPEALTLGSGAQKLNISSSDITVTQNSGGTGSAEGGTNAFFDGVGMITADQEGSLLPSNWTTDNRWRAGTKTGKANFTFEFESAKTFNEIRWTEYRKNITEVVFEFYNGEGTEPIATKTQSFDGNTTGRLYLRTVTLDEKVTADRIVFKVTAKNDTNNYTIIYEMEFWDSVTAPTITDATGINVKDAGSAYSIEKAFDRLNPAETANRFVGVLYDKNNEDALMYELPITISFDLGSVQTFNYAELRERRCVLGEIDVLYSTDGASYEKAGTMERFTYEGSAATEYVHNTSFNPVNARYVKLVIKETAEFSELPNAGTARGVNITEISLYNFSEISEEAVIYPIQRYSEDADTTAIDNTNTHITLNNTTGSAKTYMLCVASFNEDNILENVELANVTVAAAEQRTINVSSFAKATAAKVNFMVWDAVTLAPYVPEMEIVKTIAQ